MNNNCLIDELKKLKESSKEAVENITNFSEFKKYMHVKRNVQDELFNIIDKSLATGFFIELSLDEEISQLCKTSNKAILFFLKT